MCTICCSTRDTSTRRSTSFSGRQLNAEVEAAPADHVLKVDEEDWAAALAQRWAVESPVLRVDDMWQEEPSEVKVDVRHDQSRAISDGSQPVWWPGFRVVVHIPFDGDPGMFQFRPNQFTYNPPRAEVEATDLIDVIEYPHETPANIGTHRNSSPARWSSGSAGHAARGRLEPSLPNQS